MRSTERSSTSSSRDLDLQKRHAKHALLALARHPEKLVNAIDGVSLLPSTAVSLVELLVRAPHACQHLSNVLDEVAKSVGPLPHVNEASLVLELVFGRTRLVFGGDLPVRRTGGAVIDTGWASVFQRHRGLAIHHGLKVPHHGSEAALHAPLLSDPGAPADRVWWVTPYAKSALPRVHDATGLPAWLQHEASVHLTTLPSTTLVPNGTSGTWDHPIATLTKRIHADPFLNDAADTTPTRHDAFDAPVWGAAFNADGQVVKMWRGKSAVRLRA